MMTGTQPKDAATRALAIVLLLASTATLAAADDLDDAGFGNRLSVSITRFPRYADIAGFGGPSAGSRYSSAVNPAGPAFRPAVGASGIGSSAQYAALLTEEGTRVDVGSLSLCIDAGDLGILQPSILMLDSNRASTRDGIDFEWEGWSAEIQWSRKITNTTAIGINVSYLASEMDFHLDSLHLSEATSQTWQVRLGVLEEITERLYVGAEAEFAVAPSRTRSFDFLGLGIGTQREDDTANQMVLRVGLYTFLTDDLTLYADYQFVTVHDDTGRLTLHRLFLGVDQTVIEGLYVRAGGVLDSEGNVSGAVGLGLAPSASILLDVSYEFDMFPELDREFGRADLLQVGLTILF